MQHQREKQVYNADDEDSLFEKLREAAQNYTIDCATYNDDLRVF